MEYLVCRDLGFRVKDLRLRAHKLGLGITSPKIIMR